MNFETKGGHEIEAGGVTVEFPSEPFSFKRERAVRHALPAIPINNLWEV